MTDDVWTMSQPAAPPTPAIDALEASGVTYRVVRTERAHSAEESAELQGIPLGALLRTIVVRRGDDDYVFVLVPGGRRFDWPKLRDHLGVRRLSLRDADEARAVTATNAARSHRRCVAGLAGHRRCLDRGARTGGHRRRRVRGQHPPRAGGPARRPRAELVDVTQPEEPPAV